MNHTDPNLLLIAASHAVGPDVSLANFCAQYGVGDGVQDKLLAEGYTSAGLLEYVTAADLKEVGLKLGEIAALKHAVAKWSVP